MKKKIIICNWKLNGDKKFIKNFINKLNKYSKLYNNYIISISPPIIYMDYTRKLIKNKNIYLTSQNVDINIQGSFTGDISAKMLKDIYTKYIIIGHSERKIYHKENNKILLKKIIITKKLNMIPIICIGENLNEYKLKISKKICKNQLKYLIRKKGINIIKNSIIAYEPIWSIGTGKNANIKHISKINKSIKKYLINKDINIKNKFKIIYGGSINKINANKIINNKNIDGLLIGKSSLNLKEFINIIKNINNN